MKVLVTGGSGFIGSYLVKDLLSEGHNVITITRQYLLEQPREVEQVVIKDLNHFGAVNIIQAILNDVDIVIHTAARTHVLNESYEDALDQYREINVEATKLIAEISASAGVKRFIFISSVKVNGEFTEEGQLFNEYDNPMPADAYAISKFEAEQVLLRISQNYSMSVTIVRPPLVYGPGVKGNFARMTNAVIKGIPLFFDKIDNKRSMLAVANLASFIKVCMIHPRAVNQIFLVADKEDVSTAIVYKRIAGAYKKSIRNFPLPIFLFRILGKLLGKSSSVERLVRNLQIDRGKAKNLLNWEPEITMDIQLEIMSDLKK